MAKRTNETNPARLVAEARDAALRLAHCEGVLGGMSLQATRGLLRGLADALEAATAASRGGTTMDGDRWNTPWEIVQGAGIWTIEDADGATVCEAMAEEHAPALLAVPELYEACRAVLDRLDYLQSLWGAEGVTRSLADRVRAAVRKADGGH